MISRRELIAGGVAGSLTSVPVPASEGSLAELQSPDAEALRQIARAVGGIEGELRTSRSSNSLSQGMVMRVRQQMESFFRSNNKFPDFIDIGLAVFMDLYDWHVKHQQQLFVTRGVDGRYALQFMFTSLVLRPEVDAAHIGVPYDKG